MTRAHRHLLVLVGVMMAAIAACSSILGDKLNPTYCAAHPDDPDCDRVFPDCTSNAQCSSPTPVCDLNEQVCVECIAPDQTSACSATAPVCGEDQACRPCAAHSECTSQACLPDGSCGDDTSVAYVAAAPTGSDNVSCTKAMPCTTIASALATARPFVKLQGTLDEAVSIDDQNVTLLADPGAKLTRTSIGIVLEVKGTSRVAIYDLEVADGLGSTGVGISMPTGNTATLELQRVKLTNNTAGGIVSAGGSLIVSQSTLSGNQGGGISVNGGGATFDITNTFIVDNGNAGTSGSEFGGLSLVSTGVNRLEFNTIAFNHAKSGTLLSPGVACSVTGLIAPNNIITANNEGVMFPAQTKGVCTYASSYTVPGAGGNDLGFASTVEPIDLHLTSTSPSSVLDAAGTCTGQDVDGDSRPQGNACDLGADELWR